MTAGERVAARALATVGARFRLHGRDPATGLDCVGVAAVALGEAAVPTGYPLRGGETATVAALLDRRFARAQDARAGDLLLFAVGAGQLHLAVRTAAGVVHADAGLRRVVERPGVPPWPLVGAWCLRDEGGEE